MWFRDTPRSPLVGGFFLAAALVSAVSVPARADHSGFFDRIGRNTNALLESIASKEDAAFIERVVERTLAQRQPIGRTAEWKNPHTGRKGAITIVGYFERGTGDPCWNYQRTLQDDKEVSTYSGTACRELDSGSRSVDDGLRFRRETWIVQTRTVAAPTPAPVAPMKPPATMVRRAQELLMKAGFNPGPVDGLMGRRTGSAIRSYQAARSLSVDGRPSPSLVARLEKEVSIRPAPAVPRAPQPVSVPADRQPLVLAVDGIDPHGSLPESASGGGDDTESESPRFRSLRPAIVADWKLTATENIHEVAGNSADAEGSAAVRRVKGMMEAVAQLARLKKRPFVVVAHGRGAAQAYRAIKELGEARRLKPGDISVLVTLGAPNDLGRERAAPVKDIVGHWRNYWIAQDKLSNAIEGLNGAENIRADFDPARDGGDAHNAYHAIPRIWRRIGNDVARLATSS